jgi:hypothetical protein
MPKHDDPAKLAELVERLIEAAGSKAEAYRLVKAAKGRGSPGRPREYSTDDDVLFEVWMLEMVERHRRAAGVKAPKRRALIKSVVSRETADGRELGKTENAAIERINRLSEASARRQVDEALRQEAVQDIIKLFLDAAQHLPPDDAKYYTEQILKSDPSVLVAQMCKWLLEDRQIERARKQSAAPAAAGRSRPNGPILSPKK